MSKDRIKELQERLKNVKRGDIYERLAMLQELRRLQLGGCE